MADITFHKQLFIHDPDHGIFGDCQRTVLACLCGLTPAEVPHFNNKPHSECGPEDENAIKNWLAERGLCIVQRAITGTIDDLPEWLDVIGARDNPGVYYMLSGESRTGCNHVVLCKDGTIVWDTSLTDAGIIGPIKGTDQFIIEFLAPLGGAPALWRAA